MIIKDTLKKYFGFDSFRGGQKELVSAVLDGSDVLGIMPTGAGKSICFQLPAIMQSGITIVVSPLISLMKDQVGTLIQSGISAAFINSTLSPRQVETALYNAKIGQYKLIYVAPERLLSPDFLDFAQNAEISMLTVDEAHCISQWGQDFRPSYAQIPEFINKLKKRPIVSAFTATATKRVTEDIIKLLSLNNPFVLVSGFNRENLYFEVEASKDKMQSLIEFLSTRKNQSGIIYCLTRKTVEEVCDTLNASGFSALRYHAGLSDNERQANQDLFLFDKVPIMVATNAFGMGIDKSNVSYVVHYNMPKDIESYYQEAGRAGRDGSDAVCLLLYSGQDVRLNRWLIENARDTSYPDEKTEIELKDREYRRLREMTFYSTTNDCLRAFILRYFGEHPESYCGYCGNCDTKFEAVDITVESQKILSCIIRMKQRFGAAMVVDVLRGSENQRIKELEFDKLSTYGISDKSAHTLHSIIAFLIQRGYIAQHEGQYPTLSVSPKARDILNGKLTLQMNIAKEKTKASAVKKSSSLSGAKAELYNKLKALRSKIAGAQGVPAFVVFADSSLVDMCLKLPQTSDKFLTVQGVGESKLKRYGERFLKEISSFCSENPEVEAIDEIKPKPSRSAKKSSQPILPTQDTIKELSASSSPIPISTLAANINEILVKHNCSKISSVKAADWLVSQGYLHIVEENDAKRKMPTSKGLNFGITQEKREGIGGQYIINLYDSNFQKFIIDNISNIILFDKNNP